MITAAELEGDPHAALARMRSEAPVSFVPELGAWLVTSRALALEVMRDDEGYTVDDPRFSTGQVVGPSMLSRDGAEHDRHRRPFARPFRLAATREQLGAAVQSEAVRLTDAIAVAGGGDLRLDLAAPLAARVLLKALGLEALSEDEVLGWYAEIVAAVSGINLGREPSAETAAAVEQLTAAIIAAADAGAAPSLLRDAGGDATEVSPQEIASNAAVILFGGIESTEGQIAIMFRQLLADPEQLELLHRQPELRANAIEESLRHEPAAAAIDRYTTADRSPGGVPVPHGDLVTLSITAANRDPATFADPDRFDVRRDNAKLHIAFAQGPHVCLGMHLARIEMRAALDAVLDRLPALAADGPAAPVRGLVFRKPAAVPVTA